MAKGNNYNNTSVFFVCYLFNISGEENGEGRKKRFGIELYV